MIGKTAFNDKDFMMKLPQEQFARAIDGLLWGIYFHELAHAVIYINNVPMTGREEDVADQFSLWFAVNFVDLTKNPMITSTIWFWRQLAKERNLPAMSQDPLKAFLSDEHSLDEPRIYNMACWAWGTNTAGGAIAARFAGLTQARAQRCPAE